MANALLPAEWKKVLKDHKDASETTDVTKALDAYAKVEPRAKDAPQPVLDALGEVIDAAKSARSANARDKTRKPVLDFLDDVLKDAATAKAKVARLLQEKTERDREGEDGDEAGDDERPKLTAQLIKVKKLDAESAKAFVLALGGKAHGLVISKTPAVSSDHKKRARKMREGNGKLFLGQVYGESGKYVFQLDVKPPNGLAKAIKKAVSQHSDLASIRVIARGPGGFELNDETDSEEMADLGTDTGDGEAETGEGEAETGTVDRSAEWTKKLTDWSPAIKTALAAKGPNAAAIAKLLAQATALSKPGGDLVQAIAKLTECHALAASEALARTSGNGDPETTAPTESTAGSMDAFKLRLNALKVRYDRVKDLPAGTGVKAEFLEAVKAVASGKTDLATEALDALEVRLTTAERTAGATSEIREGGVGIVAYRSALLKWQTCRTKVHDSVETLIQTVLADPETRGLAKEDWDEIEATIPTLREEVADFDNRLDDAVNAYINAPAPKKPRAMKGIRKAINAYRSALDNPLLLAMSDSGYGDYPVVSEIESALLEFEGLLTQPVTA